jgi:cyclopropane fatty-acyl-phospholipid synthase-like methyltransferase
LKTLKNSTLAGPPAPSPLQKALGRLQALFRKPAEERYLAGMAKKLAAGAKHSTLGPRIRDEEYTREKAERWAERMVAEYGLKPDHLCVEYGCGSLWAAEPILRYLAPGRYIGLDITDQFYEYGRARIGDLLREKQARLGVIAPEKLKEVAALQPDFLFSRKVLPHVAEDGLARYLANVASLLTPKTVAVLDNTPMHDDAGNLTGRRHTAEAMQKLLPPGFAIEQSLYGARLRRLA